MRESEMMHIDDDRAQHKLLDLLAKLNIKSAARNSFEDMILRSMANFGQPDQLIMDSASIAAIQKMFGK